jgi:hypothetical protein
MFVATGFNQQDIVKDGLVLWLDANDKTSYPGTGTTWRDLSRGGNNGTLTNGPTYNSANGGSIVFDGVDDNVVLGNVLNLGTGDMTINSWINLASLNTYQFIYSKAFYGGQNYRYGLGVFNDNKLWGFVQGNGGPDITPTGTTTLNTNTWYMATMVINRNSNIQLYLNGTLETLIGDATISQWVGLNFQSDNPARWASYTNTDNISPNLLLNGKIGVGQIYNRVLSAQEVLQNYNANKNRFGL